MEDARSAAEVRTWLEPRAAYRRLLVSQDSEQGARACKPETAPAKAA